MFLVCVTVVPTIHLISSSILLFFPTYCFALVLLLLQGSNVPGSSNEGRYLSIYCYPYVRGSCPLTGYFFYPPSGLGLLVTWLSDPDNLNQLVVSQLDSVTPKGSVEELCGSDQDLTSLASQEGEASEM